MKSTLIVLCLLSLSVYSGCNRSAASAATSEPLPAAVYKEGRGLQIAPAAAQLAGLETGEVAAHDYPALAAAPFTAG